MFIKNLFLRVIFIFFIYIFLIQNSYAGEEYDFAQAYIQGLAIRKNIDERAEITEEENTLDDTQTTIETIKLGYRANTDLEDAVRLLEKYKASDKQLIKETAEMTIAFYRRLIELNGEMIKFLEDLYSPEQLNNPDDVHIGKLMGRLGEITAEKEDVSRSLMYCSVLLTHALTLMPQDGATISHMIITSEERKELLRDLDSIFGDSIKDGMQTGQSYLVGAGAGLRTYLTGDLKSYDEK